MPGFGEMIVMLLMLLVVGGIGVWIYVLVDVVKNEPENPPGNERLLWILVVALLGWIGATVYWFARRPRRRARYGR